MLQMRRERYKKKWNKQIEQIKLSTQNLSTPVYSARN